MDPPGQAPMGQLMLQLGCLEFSSEPFGTTTLTEAGSCSGVQQLKTIPTGKVSSSALIGRNSLGWFDCFSAAPRLVTEPAWGALLAPKPAAARVFPAL